MNYLEVTINDLPKTTARAIWEALRRAFPTWHVYITGSGERYRVGGQTRRKRVQGNLLAQQIRAAIGPAYHVRINVTQHYVLYPTLTELLDFSNL